MDVPLKSNLLVNLLNPSGDNSVAILDYDPKYKSLWNNFVSNSKNGVFLFYRDYMEYHADRFSDNSLLFFQDDKLVGLLPAHVKDDVLYSHAGLTFGGVISDCDMKVYLMLEIFDRLLSYCEQNGFSKIIYKTIPYIYHSVPAEEDLYALFCANSRLIARNASSSIYLPTTRRFAQKRRESVNKAKNHGVIVEQTYDFESFMNLVEQVLKERHGARPVHNLEEMMLLANRFPDNIKLFASYLNGEMLAGCLIYESSNVAHGQYAANSSAGRRLGCQDVIVDYLIHDYYKDKKYFDFGVSTVDSGYTLNNGLARHKESFRASTVVYDIYEVPVKQAFKW